MALAEYEFKRTSVVLELLNTLIDRHTAPDPNATSRPATALRSRLAARAKRQTKGITPLERMQQCRKALERLDAMLAEHESGSGSASAPGYPILPDGIDKHSTLLIKMCVPRCWYLANHTALLTDRVHGLQGWQNEQHMGCTENKCIDKFAFVLLEISN